MNRDAYTSDIDDQMLLEALEQFDALLKQPKTREAEWQRLFANCPYILSRALPLQLEPRQIIPLARPGKAEVDFVIHPDPLRLGSPRGLIELKRPDQRVLKFSDRSGIVTLYAQAHLAKRQVEEYAKIYPWSPNNVLILGDEVSKFVIMGLSRHWADIIAHDVVQAQLSGLFGGVRFFGYDQIFENYRHGLPQRLMLLVPFPSYDGFNKLLDELSKFLSIDKGQCKDGHASINHTGLEFFNRNEILRAIEVASQVPHNLRSVKLWGYVPGEEWDAVSIQIFPRPSPEKIEEAVHFGEI